MDAKHKTLAWWALPANQRDYEAFSKAVREHFAPKVDDEPKKKPKDYDRLMGDYQ